MTGDDILVIPTGSATYTVTVTDNCTFASASALAGVNVFPLPNVLFTASTPSACGKLCAQFTNATPGTQSLSWSFGDGTASALLNPNHCYNSPGVYSVTLLVKDTNGCVNSATNPNMMTVYANPVAEFTLGPQPTTILEPKICFTDHSTPDVTSWYWNFDDINDAVSDSVKNPCHSYTDTGTYCVSLIVHNANGCWNTTSTCLMIEPFFALYVPNAFTPNDDGLNDVFQPKGTFIDTHSYNLMIFDRWGEMIFHTNNWDEGWDGRANKGALVAPLGTYVWRITVKDYLGRPHDLVGHVSIIK